MNILIHGGGFINKGAEAMLMTVVTELKKRLLEAVFSMPVKTEVMREWAGRAGILPVAFASHSTSAKISSLLRAFWIQRDAAAVQAGLIYPDAVEFFARLGDIDAVVDISGFALGDQLGPKTSWFHLALAVFCARRKIPLVYLPQAFGPFEHPAIASHVRGVLKTARMMYARDEQSFTHMRRVGGGSTDKIRQVKDIALIFDPAPKAVGDALLSASGIPSKKRPRVGIVPNRHVYRRAEGTGSKNVYLAQLTAIADHCVSAFGADVYFIQHEFNMTEDSDDGFDDALFSILKDTTAKMDRVGFLTTNHPAADIKSAVAAMDLLIGSRFHAVIGALSSCVPVVAVGWSHKYEELLRDFGLAQYNVPVDERFETNLEKAVEDAWQHRAEIRAKLQGVMSDIRRDAAKLMEDLAAEICRA